MQRLTPNLRLKLRWKPELKLGLGRGRAPAAAPRDFWEGQRPEQDVKLLRVLAPSGLRARTCRRGEGCGCSEG